MYDYKSWTFGFCYSLRVIMNMNKPPDEILKQGWNRSWLLVKFMYSHNFPRQILGLLGGPYIGLVVISNYFSFLLIILECKDHHSIQFFLLYRMISFELSFNAVLTEKPWVFWKPSGFPVFRDFGGFNKGILFFKTYQRVETHFLYRMRYYSKYFDL